MRLEQLENNIQFKEFIEVCAKHLMIHNMSMIVCDFHELYNTNCSKFMHLFLKLIFSKSAFNQLKSDYESTYGQYTFDQTLKKFLFYNHKNINFEEIQNTKNNCDLLTDYLFTPFKFHDKFLLIQSLKFKQYTDKDLESILRINIFSDIELKLFWKFLCKYQKLSCTFIQKHINNLKTPELAYLISKGNNQFYSCNWNTIALIKQISNEFLNTIRD